MAPPSREQIEQMAFMAMMDGIIHTSVPCNCPNCKSDGKTRSGSQPQQLKRSGSDNSENAKSSPKAEVPGSCNHNHAHTHKHAAAESKSTQSTKKSGTASSHTKSTAAANAPARSDKVNALLKAENVQAVFDVFNLTNTSKDEKDLATRVQNVTKDCKLYQETKDKILELCNDEEVDLDAVFGLLAKFRYERNMLTTAVIKGNSDREKALLCIQRVDHLMYMLQDVAKKKDSKGGDVMHKLGDIIMEIHDLAKTPSSLYDEFLDIKEEHFDLLNDHEDMHQKFVDVNSCHEKLHSSHDKLQTDHSKLLRDFADAKKKASTVGGLKNDVSRLEKAIEKSNTEKSDFKKEVERLNAELAKVNALKHENAQLKKKIATLSVQPASVEDTTPVPQAQAGKKKKGKKAPHEASVAAPATTEPATELDVRIIESDKAHEVEVAKLKKMHDSMAHELELVKTNLKQLDTLLRKAEHARDQAAEKLEVEKATARNWKDIAKGHSTERDRLQTEVGRHVTRATKLQSAVEELERTLSTTQLELSEQAEAHRHIKEELEHRSPTPAASVASHQTAVLNQDTIRLLRKIRSDTSQLARDMDDTRSYGGDVYALLDMAQLTVRRVASEVERDIEEILSVRSNDTLVENHINIPEAVMPFTYNSLPSRQTPQFSPRPENNSSMEAPYVTPSTTSSLPPYRPMLPPPGFENSPSPFSHNHNHNHPHSRILDSPSAPFSRIVEPPGLSANLGFNRPNDLPSMVPPRYNNPIAPPSSSSLHSHSSLLNHGHGSGNAMAMAPNPNVGVIGSGSRSTSTKLNATPSPISTPAPSAASATNNGLGVSGGTATAQSVNGGGLGNGAVGLDWNMWSKNTR